MAFSTITTANGVYLQIENNELVTIIRIVKIAGNKTNDKWICVNVFGLDAVELGAALSHAKKHGVRNPSLFFAQKEAEMMVANLENKLCALEAFADAANQLLHIDIQNEVAAQDEQLAADEAINENNGIDFVACYIKGIEIAHLSSELAAPQNANLVTYLLSDDAPVNAKITLNDGIYYVDKILVESCFMFGDVWDFIGSKDAEEKTVLMVYLSVIPVTARKQTDYPSEYEYAQYASGGDGYTANEVLDF